jgi:cell division protein FtsI (penicillin-binding protein 3)
MNPFKKKRIRLWRVVIIGVFFSILYGTIAARAIYIQVFKRSWLSEKAADQYERSFIFNGKRGIIYDRNHREMAVSIDVPSIAAYPAHIKDVGNTAKVLAHTLNIDVNKLERQLASKRSFVWIKRRVVPKEKKTVKELNLEGIDYIPENNRVYPNKTLAAQVLGFSGIDGHGLEGIEFYYDSYLKGEAGKFTIVKDALNRVFDAEKKIETTTYGGRNLVITLDRTIQYITERALEESVLKYSAKSGMEIVMDPKTGAVLASAHFPFFNPNSFGSFDRNTWRNRAITDQFEPGSTMKVFLAAAAIDSGECSKNTIFFCENGAYKIGKNTVHDTHSNGWLSLQHIVKFSSNIGAVKITEMIGRKRLYTMLSSFGFGAKTGIDCPGETTGSLSPYNRWSRIDAGAISFGQGISVSAIQLVTAVSAIANGGVLMKPYIVKAVMDQNGRTVKKFTPQKKSRVISAKTAGIIKKIMKSVTTEEGTGSLADPGFYSVCGKTGTAQKTDETGRYARGKYVASFLGFAPEEDPKISVLVVVDEPRENHYGGTVAAPVFKKIVLETLNYMNVPPHRGSGSLTAYWDNEVSG